MEKEAGHPKEMMRPRMVDWPSSRHRTAGVLPGEPFAVPPKWPKDWWCHVWWKSKTHGAILFVQLR